MTLLITKGCINYGMCEPECSSKAISMGDYIYEIGSGGYTECVGHCEALTCQKVYLIPDTIVKDPARVETGERL